MPPKDPTQQGPDLTQQLLDDGFEEEPVAVATDGFEEELAADGFEPDVPAGPAPALGVPVPEGPVVEADAEFREKLRVERRARLEEEMKMVDAQLAAGNRDQSVLSYRQGLVDDYNALDTGAKRDIEALQGDIYDRTAGIGMEKGTIGAKRSVGGSAGMLGALLSGAGITIPTIVPTGGGLGVYSDVGVKINPLKIAKSLGIVDEKATTLSLPVTPGISVPGTVIEKAGMAYAKEKQKDLVRLERLTSDNTIEKFASDVFAAVPSMAVAMGASLATAGLGALPATFMLEGGSAYADAIENGVSRDTAMNVGVGVGLVNGALETVGARAILKGVGANTLSEAVGKAIEKGAFRRIASSGGKEGVTEFLQEVSNIVAEKLSGQGKDTTLWQDAWRAAYSGIVGMVAGMGSTGGGIGAKKGLQSLAKRLGVEEAKSEVKDKVEAGAPTSLVKRNPDGTAGEEEAIPVEAEEIVREPIQRGKFLPPPGESLQMPLQPAPEGTYEPIPQQLPEQAGPSTSGMRVEVSPEGEAQVALAPVQAQVNAPAPKTGQAGSAVVEGVLPTEKRKPLPKPTIKKVDDKLVVTTGEYPAPEVVPVTSKPTPSAVDYPAVQDATPTQPNNNFDIVEVDQMRVRLQLLGTDTANMADDQVKQQFGALPQGLQKELDEQGRIKSVGKSSIPPAVETDAVSEAGGSNPRRIMLGDVSALEFDDPLTGSTIDIMGDATPEAILQKISDSRAKEWPITQALRDAGFDIGMMPYVTPQEAQDFLRWHMPRGWDAVVKEIEDRLGRTPPTIASSLLPGGPQVARLLQVAMEPIIVEAVAQTNVQLRKGKITYDQFSDQVKAKVRAFAASHPGLAKILDQVEGWLKAFKVPLPKQDYVLYHYSKEPRRVLSAKYAGTGQGGEEMSRKDRVIHFYMTPWKEARFEGEVKHTLSAKLAVLDMASPAAQQIINEVRAKSHGATDIDQVIKIAKKQGYDGLTNSERGKGFLQYWGPDIYPEQIDGKTNPAYVEKQMLSDEHIGKIQNIAKRFTNGVTIDPRTGNRVTAKDLGANHALVGMGADVASYVKLDNPSQITSKGVENAIRKMIQKHHSVLANNPQFFIGTWYSKDDNTLVIDISRATDPTTAMRAGEWLDQRSVGILPEIETLSAMEKADPAIQNEQAKKAFPSTYGQDKKKNIDDLPTDLKQRWDEVLKRAEKNFLDIQNMTKADLSKKGRKTNIQAAHLMMQGALKQGAVPKPRGAQLRRVTNTLVREFPNMLDDLVTSVEWYNQDIDRTMESVRKSFPDMMEAEKSRPMTETEEKLFKSMLAITSTQAEPSLNFDLAMRVLRFYAEHERLPKTSDQELFSEMFGEAVTRKTKTGETVDVQTLGLRYTEQLRAFELIENLKRDLGSYEAAVQWLHEKHSLEEVKKYGKSDKPFEYYGPGEKFEGAYILGGKRGSFFLNLDGDRNAFTFDTWEARLARFIMGEIVTKGENVAGLHTDKLKAEYITAMKRAAESVGLSPAEFQAVTWFYMKKIWREFGGSDTPGGKFSEAAAEWENKALEFEFQEPAAGAGQAGGQAGAGGANAQPGEVPPGVPPNAEQPGQEVKTGLGDADESIGAAMALFPGSPQLARLIMLGVRALKGDPKVVSPEIREALKDFARKNGMPPPPETLNGRTIDRYVSQYIDNSIKRGGGTMSSGLPFLSPQMTEAAAEYARLFWKSVPSRARNAGASARSVGYNLLRASTLGILNKDYGNVYRNLIRTMEQADEMETVVIEKIDAAFDETLPESSKNKVAEAIYTGNERFETYTDIELANGVKDSSGKQVLPPMNPREIAAYKMIRSAQEDVLSIREKTIRFHQDKAMAELQARMAKVVPGSPQESRLLQDMADLQNRIRLTENHYQELRDQGYVTLKRSGKYAVFAEDPKKPVGDPDRMIYDHAESQTEAEKIKERFAKEGYTNIEDHKVRRLPFSLASRLGPEEFDNVLRRAGLDPDGSLSPDLEKVRDQVLGRYSSSSYNLSRKFIRGYERTAENLKQSMIGQATAYKASYGRGVGKAKAMEALEASDMINTNRELHDFTLKYIDDETGVGEAGEFGQKVGAAARRLTYMLVLGFEIGQFFLNAIAQPITVTYPYFARKEFGLTGTEPEKYFVRGVKLAGQSIKGQGPKEFLDMRNKAVKQGKLGKTLTEELMRETGTPMKAIERVGSFFTRHGEIMTRSHAFAEAYLVGKEKLKLSGDKLYEYMVTAVDNTQGRPSRGEMPGWARSKTLGELGKYLYQFQSFQQIWAENLGMSIRSDLKNFGVKNGKRMIGPASTRQLAALMAVGGSVSMPFSYLIMKAIAGLTGDDPDEFIRKHITKSKKAADVLKYGATGMPGVSSRVKITLPGEMDKPSWTDYVPAASLVSQWGTAVKDASAGEWGLAVEGALPRFLRGPAKAYRYATEGYKPRGQKRVAIPASQFTTMDILGQVFGISPAPVVRYWEKRMYK